MPIKETPKKTILDYPNLIKEWDFDKNFGLSPEKISKSSWKKIWWICPVSKDHSWEIEAYQRTRGRGCPCCRGLKVVESNCLATTNPDIAMQWNYEKNIKLNPKNVVSGSSKKVWWKCNVAKDHEWEATINDRVSKKSGCPFCAGKKVSITNSLAFLYPNISKEWDKTKNTIAPDKVTSGSEIKVWWQCSINKAHEWKCAIYSRTSNKSGCPFCNEKMGEKEIEKYLILKCIKYKKQYKIDGCKNKRHLPFDFAIFIDDKIKLIEYQGQHHYIENSFGSKNFKNYEFIKIKERDMIKKEFCKKENIDLLEIPYYNIKNLEKILKDYIFGEI